MKSENTFPEGSDECVHLVRVYLPGSGHDLVPMDDTPMTTRKKENWNLTTVSVWLKFRLLGEAKQRY